jgi:hypothetical protein
VDVRWLRFDVGAGSREAFRWNSLWRLATFETLRRAFLENAVRDEDLKSHARVALPSTYPYRNALIVMAAGIDAQGP